MRLIDADALHKAYMELRNFKQDPQSGDWISLRAVPLTTVIRMLNEAPSIDIVPCQACKWYEDPNHKIFENCVKWKDSHGILLPTKPNDFCSYGERRTDG